LSYVDALQQVVASICEPSDEAMAAARQRQNILTKPQGSLGRLEELSIRVAGMTGTVMPPLARKAVIVMAGDHGVAAEGVSAFPQAVTVQMVANFLAGGAGINVLARHVGARVVIVDIGVAGDIAPAEGLLDRKMARGTANIAQGPAMTREQAAQAIMIGVEVVREEYARGLDMVATGDMGIANTTPSSAVVAAITGRPPADVTGRGTGIDDSAWAHKVSVIERSLAVNQPDGSDGLDVLAKVGGLEIGGLAGVVLGAAASRIPVVVDGFISTAGALIATEICPAARHYVIAAHRSVEVGHQAALDRIGTRPLLDLGMRLGEGTGAALAMNIVEGAGKVLAEMATFESAGVSNRDEE
jgi:nicotinate-nucleotide--dimethylbenzimidazole phosphoribosyltransferase